MHAVPASTTPPLATYVKSVMKDSIKRKKANAGAKTVPPEGRTKIVRRAMHAVPASTTPPPATYVENVTRDSIRKEQAENVAYSVQPAILGTQQPHAMGVKRESMGPSRVPKTKACA